MDSRLLFALLGAVIGLAISEEPLGLGIGAALGWLFAEIRRLATQVQRLELLLKNNRAAVPSPLPAAAEPELPKPTPAAATEVDSGAELDWTLPDEVLQNAPTASPAVPAKPAPQWTPPPVARPAATEPDWATRLVQAGLRFFTEGNPAVKIGLLLLFFGVAFLLRYASEHISVSLVWRLNGVAAAGAGLLGLGLWFVPRKRLYGLLLQGGGIGILYMTAFAALRLFHLLEATPTFMILAALAALSAFLALRQDARVLASFGFAGGFLAPVLASTGEGNHIQLFSYYALLNAGLALIAWHKNWRELNLLGFTFTFVVGVIWGVTRYQPGLFHSVEPFLLLFCALYLMIGVRFALRQDGRQPAIDSTILFGTPLAFIGLQQPLVAPWEYGLAISSALAAGVYATLWWLLRQRAPLLLKDALAGTALVLGSLAIPLALPGEWTAVCWAAEGTLVLHFGLRQQRHWGVLIALLLQFGAGMSLLFDTPSHPDNWSDPRFWSALILALCALFSAARLRLTPMRWRALEAPLLGWAALFWYGAWIWQLERLLNERPLIWAVITLLTISAITWAVLEARLNWRKLALARFVLPLLLALCLTANAMIGAPLEGWGWLAWLLALAGSTLLLRVGRDADAHLALRHALNLWLGLAVLAVQVDYWVGDWTAELNWNLAAQLLLAAVLVRLLPRLQLAEEIENAYHEWTPALLCSLGGLLWLAMLFPAPGASPFDWLALFNPLDLPQLVALLAFWNWARQRLHTRADLAAAGAAFLLLNAIALRTLAINLNLPWDASALFASDKVQTALAILWTLGGVASMALSRKHASRPLWIGGAVLLGMTVLKLFLVDLGNSGTLERIVSFIGVGLLLLIIGYIAPLPPADSEQAAGEQ